MSSRVSRSVGGGTLPRTSKTRSRDCVVPAYEWAWIENVQGLCDPEEGEWLANRAAEVPHSQAIVEIGTHTGQSTLWMAAGSIHGNQARVYAVDPWPDPGYTPEGQGNDDPFDLKTGEAVHRRFVANIRGQSQDMPNRSYEELVWEMRMPSLEAAKVWGRAEYPQAIGLLFIDAIHTFEGVKADVDAWQEYVAPGGWLALNDYWLDPDRTQLNGAAFVAKELLEPSRIWVDTRVVWNTWVGKRA
jgi:hypothetical protein